MLCSRIELLVLDVLVRSGLPVLPVPVLVLFVLVLFVLVLFVLFVLAVLAVLVLVDWPLLAENVCALIGSGPTRASSSSVASIETRGAPCWRSLEKGFLAFVVYYIGTSRHAGEGLYSEDVYAEL